MRADAPEANAQRPNRVHEEAQAEAGLSDEWRRALAWIERELDGKAVRFERQPRWRPAAFLDLERDGQSIPLYFRGDRGASDHGVYPLEHEMRVLQVLEAHGIPVPHIYGFCPDPRGIVMARAPGRPVAQLVSEEAGTRQAVFDDYIDILARMHRIDPAALEAIGLSRPRQAQELALVDFDAWERVYRGKKRRPEPLIEFVIRWVRGNIPQGRNRVSLLTGDCGQFLYRNDRVTVLHDLELACLGDPAADLAGLRCRDTSEPLGDLARAIRRYGEIVGEEVDLEAVDFHTVRLGICTPMSVQAVVADPPPGTNLVQYLAWYLVYARLPLEVLAWRLGVELTPIDMPEERQTRHSPGYRALVSLLDDDPRSTVSDRYRIDAAGRIAEYIRRADLLGPAFEEQDLDEMGVILGRRPANWIDGDAALEALVLTAAPERSAEFVRYFHRRMLRQEALLKPVMRELEHANFQRIR
ncbi:MAG: phosphotransferase family protein [Candidatus Binatia bacterium]